jgi:hypothetical protein
VLLVAAARCRRWAFIAVVATIVIGMSACSSSGGAVATSSGDSGNSQVVRDYEVLLAPSLQGGTVGWCLTVVMSGQDACAVPEASTGPIVMETENCGGSDANVIVAYALVRQTVAVSIVGGPPIPTRTEPSLPNGLRAVFVEIRYQHVPSKETCPRFTPLDEDGKPITEGSTPTTPLAFQLPGLVRWQRRGSQRLPPGAHLPPGVCEISPIDLLRFSARSGIVVRRIVPSRVALGPVFTSCASTEYRSQESQMTAAVLLDAEHPGSKPAPLPGMKPAVGHAGVFQAHGSEGVLLGLRVPGAWLVVEEGGTDLQEPLTLLEHLHATVHL